MEQQQTEGGDPSSPTPTKKRVSHYLCGPTSRRKLQQEALIPTGPNKSLRNLSTLTYVSAGQAGKVGPASNGDQMGHGPWGQGPVHRKLQQEGEVRGT